MTHFLSKKQKLGVALAVLEITAETKAERKLWAKKWLMKRRKFTHALLLKELGADDFRNYLRMNEDCFMELLSLVRPFIKKQDTVMREAISCEERLLATLRYLATGRSYEDLKFSTIISPQLLSLLIPETCCAVYRCLKKYIKMPNSENEWEDCATNFEEKWNFSHCVGSMDGKHIAIKKPPGSGSLPVYYNYKYFFSVILFAVVNADYQFMFVHVGTNGCVSDAAILNKTNFHRKLLCGDLGLPVPSLLPNSNKSAPYVFVGDSAFALHENVMKPFPLKSISKERRIFNYRLSRARRVVENAFGILASRFRILQQTLGVGLDTVDDIVLACCALHNFLSKKNNTYISGTNVDREDVSAASLIPGDWRQSHSLVPLAQATQRQRNEVANDVRETFTSYFNNEGQVAFQEAMILNANM